MRTSRWKQLTFFHGWEKSIQFQRSKDCVLLPAVPDHAGPSIPQRTLRGQTEPVSTSFCLAEQAQLF